MTFHYTILLCCCQGQSFLAAATKPLTSKG
ncbi:hypothetical protein MelnitzEXVC044M_141 [Methylophilales phage Melnitz EXVC044M]|nr:hypothetical protein Melnitz1EXVC043M_140 [Methylophilales phage Melnitz-1 EXVC043M]QZI94647.1 hypothetical protein Melnitz2EXVC040M_141 [Methylophilales phage Melnitz-2 EXVC040M]QZI94869.1 hypothetical protein MelnitzEXVC044M_141 [Methylophilales phage Melnitz EXVC044M]QZI95090.1 hypothetical protein Melnitz3EXVC039M_141 [Methylophilales phage Melnitz-3 EXVC039M]